MTIFMDWRDSELESLGSLIYHKDLQSNRNSIQEYENTENVEDSFTISRKSRSFCEDPFTQYSTVDSFHPTSWITAIIEIAETTLNEKNVRLSTEQLFTCFPQEMNCTIWNGVDIPLLTQYLSQVGLVKKDEFSNCNSISKKTRFFFDIVVPVNSTNAGIMELISQGKPVFTAFPVNMTLLRYQKTMTGNEKPLQIYNSQKSNLYGMITYYDSNTWGIVTYPVGCEEFVLRLDRKTALNSVFSLRQADIPCIYKKELIVTQDSMCTQITKDNWRSIVVQSGLCNNIFMLLSITDNPCLQSIYIKSSSLINIKSLTISNNNQLEEIFIDRGNNWENSPFSYTDSVVISSMD